jgi:hypothetical protein
MTAAQAIRALFITRDENLLPNYPRRVLSFVCAEWRDR